MKRLFLILIAMACLATYSCAPGVDIEAEKAQVQSVLDQWYQMVETENLELFSRIMAHDPDMVTFGTDAAERWVGWEALNESVQKQFESFENVKISVTKQVIKISESGTVAWVSWVMDCDLLAQGEPVSMKGARITGVLEKRQGSWVIVQCHTSIPVAGQAVEY
jgi:uncharacterized protein (TIGR02246 family)